MVLIFNLSVSAETRRSEIRFEADVESVVYFESLTACRLCYIRNHNIYDRKAQCHLKQYNHIVLDLAYVAMRSSSFAFCNLIRTSGLFESN